jgi:hypothetical protein
MKLPFHAYSGRTLMPAILIRAQTQVHRVSTLTMTGTGRALLLRTSSGNYLDSMACTTEKESTIPDEAGGKTAYEILRDRRVV